MSSTPDFTRPLSIDDSGPEIPFAKLTRARVFGEPALRPVDPEDGAKLYAASGIDPARWIDPARRRRKLDLRRAAAEARILGVHPAEIKTALLAGDFNLARLPFPQFEAAVVEAVSVVMAAPSAAVALVNAGGRPDRFTALDLIAMEIQPPSWLIEDVIPEGTMMLGGKPKTGKSFLALQIALAACAGDKAFGTKDVMNAPGAGLYISLDPSGLGGMKSRQLAMLAEENGTAEPPEFEYARRWPRGTEGVKLIAEWLDDHEDARIVVIDTFSHFREPPTTKMNPYDQDHAATSEISDVMNQYEVSSLIVHHAGKAKLDMVDSPMDLLSGTTGLLGGVENGAVIMKTTTGYVFSVQPREFEAVDWAVERGPTGLWTILGNAADQALKGQNKAVMDVLKKNPDGLRANDISQLTDVGANSLRKVLERLREKDLVIRQNEKWVALTPAKRPSGGDLSMSPPGAEDPF